MQPCLGAVQQVVEARRPLGLLDRGPDDRSTGPQNQVVRCRWEAVVPMGPHPTTSVVMIAWSATPSGAKNTRQSGATPAAHAGRGDAAVASSTSTPTFTDTASVGRLMRPVPHSRTSSRQRAVVGSRRPRCAPVLRAEAGGRPERRRQWDRRSLRCHRRGAAARRGPTGSELPGSGRRPVPSTDLRHGSPGPTRSLRRPPRDAAVAAAGRGGSRPGQREQRRGAAGRPRSRSA